MKLVCDIVVKRFTFAISSPDERLFSLLQFFTVVGLLLTPCDRSSWLPVSHACIMLVL